MAEYNNAYLSEVLSPFINLSFIMFSLFLNAKVFIYIWLHAYF